MLDRAIIDHASPTLARLKLGSLINLETGEGFFGELSRPLLCAADLQTI